MPLDDKLAELDALLKGMRISALAIAARAFDPEIVELEEAIDRARFLVADIRLEINFLRERME